MNVLKNLFTLTVINIVSILIVSILMGIYIYHIFPYLEDIVIFKDDSILYIHQFMESYCLKTSLFDKFIYIFKQSLWPHPHITSRLLGIISYELTGEMDFKALYLIGHIGVFMQLLLLKMFSKIKSNYIFIFIALIILIPVFPNSFWLVAMYGYIYHILYSLATLHFYAEKKTGLFILFGFMTVFSGGQGIFIFIPIIMYEMFNWFRTKSNIQSLVEVLVIFGVLLTIFILVLEDRQTSEQSSSIIDSLFNLSELRGKILVFFAFLGQSFKFPLSSNTLYSSFMIGLGLLMFNMFIYIKDEKRFEDNLPFYLFFIYIFIMAFFTALMRSKNQFGEPVIWYRYDYYSSIYICSLLLLCYKVFKGSKIVIFSIFVLTTLNYYIKGPVNFDRAKNQRLFRVEKAVDLLQGKMSGKVISNSITKAVQTGVYKPVMTYPQAKKVKNIGKEGDFKFKIQQIQQMNKSLFIQGIALNPDMANTGFYKTYILFKNNKTGDIYSIRANRYKLKNPKKDVNMLVRNLEIRNKFYEKNNFSNLGFKLKMLRYQKENGIPEGTYTLGVLLVSNKKKNYVFTEHIVKFFSTEN